MPIPGHRRSPPKIGTKQKTAVTIKLLRQFSRTPHSVLAKRQWQTKPWELRFFTSKVQRRTENLFLWKITYGKSIKAGLLTYILKRNKQAFSVSQWPAFAFVYFLNVYSDWYRHGFSPCSLFTDCTFWLRYGRHFVWVLNYDGIIAQSTLKVNTV